MKKSFISLTTDFGTADIYVAVMKGVIVSINPDCSIIDITHALSPQDIVGAYFAINSSYRYFPQGTIHIVVVDPGVGSGRRPILVETEQYYFIGPDNGVFTLVLGSPALKAVYHLTNDTYFLSPFSATFHGRDMFAPVAAHLAHGTEPAQFGPVISDYVLLDWPAPSVTGTGAATGQIIHIDHFGNIITNFSRAFLAQATAGHDYTVACAGRTISRTVAAYAYAPRGELCCLCGSSDFLEIAVPHGSAADLLKAKRGDPVKLLKQ